VKGSLHDFYANLVQKDGWKHIAPMLNIVATIETEIQKRHLVAFTSHEILRVTAHEAHADRVEDDILSIAPDRSGYARVVYQSKSDRQALPIVEFLDRGGSDVSYDSLVSTIIPYLERLARV
jgi:hypothetical protein